MEEITNATTSSTVSFNIASVGTTRDQLPLKLVQCLTRVSVCYSGIIFDLVVYAKLIDCNTKLKLALLLGKG